MATLHERKRERERRKAFLPILLFKTIPYRGFGVVGRKAAKFRSAVLDAQKRTEIVNRRVLGLVNSTLAPVV